MSATSNGHRRWFRFGLRTLLAGVTVFCIWLGFKVNAARRQHEAVQAILQAGGTVAYDFQMVPVPAIPDDFNIDSRASLSTPTSLRSIFGDDFFRNVIYVGFAGTGADFDLTRLADLPSIRRIAIRSAAAQIGGKSQMRLRDNDLTIFEKLSQLHDLSLIRQDIDGPGLQSLVGLKRLKQLHLAGTLINDEGLEQIGKLITLENVVITPDRITDAGWHYLSTIPKLNFDLMGLPNSPKMDITNSRLDALSQLDNLDVLSIHNAHFTDETSLKCLGNLKNLGGLNFLDCDVTDAGLQSLAEGLRGNTKLVQITFQKSRATVQGILELQKALPNATVLGP